MTDLIILPDVERLLSAFLRGQTELTALVGDRIYTALPTTPTFPALRLTRLGGVPLLRNLIWLDNPLVQLDAWGGTKAQAHDIAEMARAVLDARLVGVHPDGIVANVTFGEFRYLPDAEYTPAKPRYIASLTCITHPGTGGS